MSAEILPLRLTPASALQIVREIARDTSRVGFVGHAKSRMRARRITPTQVYRCLRAGVIAEGPYLDIKGYWRCTLETLSAGDRIQVVAAFNSKERLIVITAI